jgi:hypothetical protein
VDRNLLTVYGKGECIYVGTQYNGALVVTSLALNYCQHARTRYCAVADALAVKGIDYELLRLLLLKR